MISSDAAGVLAIWHDIEASAEAAVLDWYSREHHLERVSIPGFAAARRWRAISGAPKYFIYYRVLKPEVLSSEPYLARVNNPTPWTRRSMPFFRNNSRTVCSVTARHGAGEGAVAATIRLTPAAAGADSLRQWLIEEVLPEVSRVPGIASAELWEAHREATTIQSEERVLRRVPDVLADWVVVLTGHDAEAVGAASLESLALSRLGAAGAAGAEHGLYQLEFLI